MRPAPSAKHTSEKTRRAHEHVWYVLLVDSAPNPDQ